MREEDGSSEIQYVSYPLHASATNDNLWYTFGTDHLSPLSTTVHALGLTMNVAKSSSLCNMAHVLVAAIERTRSRSPRARSDHGNGPTAQATTRGGCTAEDPYC